MCQDFNEMGCFVLELVFNAYRKLRVSAFSSRRKEDIYAGLFQRLATAEVIHLFLTLNRSAE